MAEERRSGNPGRRAVDREVYDMSKEALETAREAREMALLHITECRQQNIDILRRLGLQDKILYGIGAGIGLELLHMIATAFAK